MGNPADLKPGSMISVQLLSGDLSVGADGTVTHIDGARMYAFGHRFLAVGSTALPFARAEVVALLPNLNTSFKLATAKEWMGTIGQDRDTAISGELGKRAPTVPVSIAVTRNGRPVESYECQMVNDPLLSPLLLQMAVFSAIDATERTVGAASLRVTGEIEFRNAAAVHLNNIYSADNGSAMLVSLTTAVPMAYVMQSGFRSLELKKVTILVEAFDQKKQLTIDSVTASRREVRPGEKVQLNVLFLGDNGAETTRQVEYQVPIGAAPGPLYFTVADAGISNLADFRQILTANPRSVGQLSEYREQSAPQQQGVCADLARGTGVSARWRRPARAAAFRGADSGGLRSGRRRHHADAQFQNRGIGTRRRRHGHLRSQNHPGGNQGMTPFARPLVRCAALAAALAAALPPALLPSGTATWEMNSYNDFVRGRFTGISLSREGRLSLAPKMDTVFTSDQPVIWSVAEGPDGSVYAATGHRGRVYRIDRSGKATLLWTADQPEVFAIAVDAKGVVYAGTSPDGKVYRIEDGKASEYFAPKARYIWCLAVAPDGALYVGTGDQGKIFRVESACQRRGVLRDRPVAYHRPGGGFARPPAGGHRSQRHPLPHFGQGQGLRAVRCQPAGDPRHRPHAGRHRLRGRAGRLRGPAGAGGQPGDAGDGRGGRSHGHHHHHGGSPGRRDQAAGANPADAAGAIHHGLAGRDHAVRAQCGPHGRRPVGGLPHQSR